MIQDNSELAKTKVAQVKVMMLARRLGEDMSPGAVVAAVSMALGALVEHLKNDTATREALMEAVRAGVTIGADEYAQFEANKAKAEGRLQ